MNVEREDIVIVNGVYKCPCCSSVRITEISQNILIKYMNVNTGKLLNPDTGESYMSNCKKAFAYDNATTDGVGCWFYECRKCGWKSKMYVE